MKDTRVVLLCLFALFAGLALGRCFTNLPWVDEGWFFDPVYNWIYHGHTGTTVMEGKGFPWDGIERHQYWQPPFHLVVDLVWLKIFGTNLVALRSLSVAAGISLLLCWVILLRHFDVPDPVMLLSMTFIATDFAVLRAGSDGRTDMLGAAFGLGAVTTYLKLREKNFTLAIMLSQILLVCGGLTHPIGGLLYMALIAYFFITGKDWRRLRPLDFAVAAIPYAIGAAGWGWYIAKEPDLFWKIFAGSSAAGRLSGISNPMRAVRNEIMIRYLTPFGLLGQGWVMRLKLLIPLTYFAAAALAWIIGPVRRQQFLRPIQAMWIIACISLLLLDNQRNGTYMVHVFPLYAILLASVVWWACQKGGGVRVLATALSCGFVMLQLGGTLLVIRTNGYHHQYQEAVNFVEQHARPGDRIVGTSELGFGIGFDRLHDDMALGYYVGKRPDVIIMSPRYRAWYEAVRGDEPLHSFIESRLDEFQSAYANDAFQVYLPKTP